MQVRPGAGIELRRVVECRWNREACIRVRVVIRAGCGPSGGPTRHLTIINLPKARLVVDGEPIAVDLRTCVDILQPVQSGIGRSRRKAGQIEVDVFAERGSRYV